MNGNGYRPKKNSDIKTKPKPPKSGSVISSGSCKVELTEEQCKVFQEWFKLKQKNK